MLKRQMLWTIIAEQDISATGIADYSEAYAEPQKII